jgi:AcrR family transcriptional regulator
MPDSSPPLSGRRAEAVRNTESILEAAREVFTTDRGAPISQVAERAGVGIGALYRRYASKEALLRALCSDGLARYVREVESALDDQRAPAVVFADFMRRTVDANTHALTLNLAGMFQPDDELWVESARADELNRRLYARLKQEGILRLDVEVEDFAFIFEQLAAIEGPSAARTAELRHRYLALILQALRAPGDESLPGPPPNEQEVRQRWTPQRG